MSDQNNNVVRIPYAHLSCKTCAIRDACPSCNATQTKPSASVSAYSRTFSRGDHLFRQGDVLKNLYVVRSGSLKSYLTGSDGEEYVIKFYLPGELVGLDALAENRHESSAQVLETTSLCRVATESADGYSRPDAVIDRQLLKLASREMLNEHERALLVAQHDAGERIAQFLLQLSDRYAARGFSGREFNLPMSRHDIASYLALAVETVSREFTRLQNLGLISVDRRHIQLLSPDGMMALRHPPQKRVAH